MAAGSGWISVLCRKDAEENVNQSYLFARHQAVQGFVFFLQVAVNLFSNTAIWGHNHIGRKLKIRQR